MDIIFVTLPKYLLPFVILLKKLGHNTYYLTLSGSFKLYEDIWTEKLKKKQILPLPIENLPHITGFSEGQSDPEMIVFKRTQQLAPADLISGIKKLYPKNTKIVKKLQIIVNDELANKMRAVTRQVNIWARANPNQNILLIDVKFSGLLTPALVPNVTFIILPMDIFAAGVAWIINLFRRITNSKKDNRKQQDFQEHPQKNHSNKAEESRVAFVIHQGLAFGNLFEKNLFYSSEKDSELHQENMIHLDYSGFPSPSEKIIWEHIGNHRHSWAKNFYNAIIAFSCGFLHIRSMNNIIGLFILTYSYIKFKSFIMHLEKYTSLELALIDYEILCPKELLLAFEEKGIIKIAAQERFTISNNHLMGSILTYYLCASQFAAELMNQSPTYCVDHYIPVGQYRSDILFHARTNPPPGILMKPIAKGYRIITVFGFHTEMKWQYSQKHPLVNWTAHQHFLDDMIRLSQDLPNVFIVLRYKDTDWIGLPIFAETVSRIQSSDNMAISMDYSKSFFSYDLCAHSDLVIAKPTSIADECLSIGIPVLFHGFFHNFEEAVSDAFEYNPTKVMCYNYEELLERAQIVLSGTPNEMTKDYEYLKNIVYGRLGDGKVNERIHNYIDKLLSHH